MLPLNIGIDHVNNCLVIINIPYLHLDRSQPGPLCRMEPPVPTDDLIPALCAASHGQVGEHTVLPNAVHQLLHILIVAHLKWMPDERMQLGKRHLCDQIAAFPLPVSLRGKHIID